MAWKTAATLVYIAYPLKKTPRRFRLLEKLGIGLLGVSTEEVREIVEIMPKEPSDLLKVLELHPRDPQKEMELARVVKETIR